MAASATLGFPFTAAQWKELERQAMIYKYMVASVPVPYQLLLPIIQNLPPSHSHSPLVRQLAKQDLEPGRCKRTDGKKWRCSRDVAPNQKYCERHMHRGRPRSRKHVELSKNHPSSSLLPNNTRLPSSNQPCKVLGSTILPSATATVTPQPCFFLDNIQSNKRGSDWSTEQQWRQIMQTSRSIFNNDFGEDHLQSFTDFHDYLDDKSNVIKDSSSTGNLDLSMSMGLGLGVSPLAEVLRPPNPNPSCPYDGGSSAVSSPSGVLQRTMLSFSDSNSNSNSHSHSHSPPPTDIVAFQWLS